MRVIQQQIADLPDTFSENVTMHLRSIYAEGELDRQATVKKNLVARQEGQRRVRLQLQHYNLNAILSAGYRVSFAKATRFRQWATRVLREHVTRGHTIDRHRCESNARELEKVPREQFAELCGRDRTVIGRHVRNVFKEGVLDEESEESNVQSLHIAGSERPVCFRPWATRVLRDRVIRGNTLDRPRFESEARGTKGCCAQGAALHCVHLSLNCDRWWFFSHHRDSAEQNP